MGGFQFIIGTCTYGEGKANYKCLVIRNTCTCKVINYYNYYVSNFIFKQLQWCDFSST